MHRLMIRSLLLVLLGSAACMAQENMARVGVAIMQNEAGRSVSGIVERDRLVKAINQLKPDKKTHLKVEAIPLNGSNSDDLGDEAKQKNCQYVVYTRLTELRSQQDPYQHQAGAIETNPNSQWSSQNSSLQGLDPEYRATVNYKLVEVSSNSAVSGAPFSTQQNGNEIDTVSQIMDRIALQVADQIKKGTPAMRE